MKEYKNFDAVLEAWESLPIPGRLYIEGEKASSWRHSKFWAVSSREAKDAAVIEDVFGSVPDLIAGEGAKSFLETATFQDIVENKIDSGTNINDGDILYQAVMYYLEFDDFEE